MEEIRVRMVGSAREDIVADLLRPGGLPLVYGELLEIRIYVHPHISTDLLLQLSWSSETVPAEGSAVGTAMGAGLKSVGIVNHSVWREINKGVMGPGPKTRGPRGRSS